MKIEELVGQTVFFIKGGKDDEEVTFTLGTGVKVRMYHPQNCCENVWLEDIVGDMCDLLDSEILEAKSIDSTEDKGNLEWTFYRISTIKGTVVFRWCSNIDTYYGTEVIFEKLPDWTHYAKNEG